MSKRNGQTIYHDEYGSEYCRDADGNKIPPMTSEVISKPGEFTIYDSSNGHCALCGSLTCRGSCFK